MRRSLAVTALAVAVVGLGSSPAYAHDGGGDPRGEGEFVPADPADYPPVEFEACGSVITLSNGDVFEVEERVTELPNGGSLIEFRGDWTVDLVRKSDGATIDELDISGDTWELVSADGTEVLVELEGPSIVWAVNEVERADADEAGQPYFLYYEEGTVLLRLEVDPATGESLAADTLRTDVAEEDEVDLCAVLDEAAADAHDDSGRGTRDD